jgi:hypothetical protein
MLWTILSVIIICAASYFMYKEQSETVRGFIGALIALSFLLGLQKYLVIQAAKAANKKIKLFDLIITSEDNRYSLSRFQIYIWTVWIVIAFVQVAFSTYSLPSIPQNIAILMGINGFTSALSTAITDTDKLKRFQAKESDFFRNIFLDSKGTLDLPRTQMFIWTFVILVMHISIFFNNFMLGRYEIPNIDSGLLILMGVSNGAYLGVKAAEEKNK